MDSNTHTLSFCILDDLTPKYGPVHVKINDLTYKTISNAVEMITQKLKEDDGDCTGFYVNGYYSSSTTIDPHYDNDEVTGDLLNNGSHVINSFEKYYVIAYSLDYNRFKVFSRGCYKKLIEWRDDDENDPIVKVIDSDHYGKRALKLLTQYV